MTNKEPAQPRQEKQEDRSYTPASPVKRTLAWIGLAYMVIILALTTYFYYTASMLTNLGPLLVIPGLVGLGILALVSWRTTGRPGKAAALLLCALCWVLALASLPLGIAGLLSNFGTVFTVP